MISQLLARVETELGKLLDLMYVDATYEQGKLKTVFVSTEHDPSVGIYGGPVFTLWWEVGTAAEKKRWPRRVKAGDFPTDVFIVKEKWDVPKEEWEEEMRAIMQNRKVIFDALLRIEGWPAFIGPGP